MFDAFHDKFEQEKKLDEVKKKVYVVAHLKGGGKFYIKTQYHSVAYQKHYIII